MSTLTYEEAIAKLKSMFGAKWTEDLLGAVLEHQNMHMENTVGTIVDHEDDDPADVVAKLQNPSVAAAAAAAAAADALAPADEASGGSVSNPAAQAGPHKYRVGQKISKYFPSHGNYFEGKIDRLVPANYLKGSVPGVPSYHIKYKDGDEEHMAEDEITHVWC